MNIKKMPIYFLLCLLFLTSCFGDSFAVYPETDTTLDLSGTNTDGIPIDSEFFEGGGTGGDFINGQVNIFIIDEDTKQPVRGAKVKIENESFKMLTDNTNEHGFVRFLASSIQGTVTLDILAKGYVFETVMGLKVTNITIPIKPEISETKEKCTIYGAILSVDTLPLPTNEKQRVALIYYSPSVEHLLSKEDVWAKYPTDSPLVVMPDEDSAFSIEVPQKAGVLYVLGGLVNKNNNDDPSDDFYEISMLGIAKQLDVTTQTKIVDAKLTFEIPLLALASIKAIILPPIYESRQEDMGLNLGDLGIIWFRKIITSSFTLFNVPQILDFFSEASIIMMAKAMQNTDAIDESGNAISYPKSIKIVRDIATTFDEFSSKPYIFELPLSPPQSLKWDGEELSYLPLAGYSLSEFLFSQISDEKPLWRITILGEIPQSVLIPDIPANWEWNGVPDVDVQCRIWTAQINADMNNMMFNNFSKLVKDIALNKAVFKSN